MCFKRNSASVFLHWHCLHIFVWKGRFVSGYIFMEQYMYLYLLLIDYEHSPYIYIC